MLRPKPPPRFLDAKRIDEEGDGHVTILYDRKAADEHAIAAASVTTASNLFAFSIYTHPCSLRPWLGCFVFPRQKLSRPDRVHRLSLPRRISSCWIAAGAMVNAGDSPEAVAAQKLLQMKHYQPSIGECRATSQLLSTILHQTNALYSSDQRKSLTTPRCSTAVAQCIAAGDDDERELITRLPIPLADTNDEEYLSPLQCYIRKTCLEYFAADASNATSKGRQTLVSEGRVGVRCVFCKHLPRDEQAAQASEYYLRHCFPPAVWNPGSHLTLFCSILLLLRRPRELPSSQYHFPIIFHPSFHPR